MWASIALCPVQWNAAKSGALATIATVEPTMNSGFLDVLHAHGPAVDREKNMALYGQFIGSWDTDIVTHEPNGVEHRGNGEIHFGWVLEGRAIQDVWMIPRRAERRPDMPALPVAGNWYGTTLRVYDPGIDAWHILWTDPANQIYTQQIGRARGVDIVQEGKLPTGAILRWSFTPDHRPFVSLARRAFSR